MMADRLTFGAPCKDEGLRILVARCGFKSIFNTVDALLRLKDEAAARPRRSLAVLVVDGGSTDKNLSRRFGSFARGSPHPSSP
jgi:hypothetical protein